MNFITYTNLPVLPLERPNSHLFSALSWSCPFLRPISNRNCVTEKSWISGHITYSNLTIQLRTETVVAFKIENE